MTNSISFPQKSIYFNIKKNRRSLFMQTVFNRAEEEIKLLWKLTCLCKLSHFTQRMTRVTRQAAQGTIHLRCRPFGHMFNESFKLRMRRFPREVNQNVKTSKSIWENSSRESSILSMSPQKFHAVRLFPTETTSVLIQDFCKYAKEI